MAGGAEGRYRVRVITPDDWGTWRSLRLEALAEAPYAFGSRLAEWEPADESRWRDRLALPGSRNLMVVRDETPVGMATGVPGDEDGTAALISMYVTAAERGGGASALLIDAVATWAEAQGFRQLCLDVRADNGRARRLYERHGFVVCGDVARESPDDPLELRMCRRLAGAMSSQDASTRR